MSQIEQSVMRLPGDGLSRVHDWVRQISVLDLFVLQAKMLAALVLVGLAVGIPVGIIAGIIANGGL